MLSEMERRRPLDAIDAKLLDALRREPRATNKALAAELGVSEVSVAARLKALERDNVFRVIAQLDFRALDYDVLAIADVRVCNGQIKTVAEALARVEGVGSVSLVLGDPPIIIQLQARGIDGLSSLVLNEIATIPGVEQVETNIIAAIAKWTPDTGLLEPQTPFDEDDQP